MVTQTVRPRTALLTLGSNRQKQGWQARSRRNMESMASPSESYNIHPTPSASNADIMWRSQLTVDAQTTLRKPSQRRNCKPSVPLRIPDRSEASSMLYCGVLLKYRPFLKIELCRYHSCMCKQRLSCCSISASIPACTPKCVSIACHHIVAFTFVSTPHVHITPG